MSKGTMRAVVVRAPGDFGVEDVPVPTCPRDGLLLRVLACGLCGSDLRTLRSGHHRVKLPYTIGHEFTGEMVAVGDACNTGRQPGESVAVGPVVYCGQCSFCRAGQPELCDGYREIAQHWPGGFAEYVALPGEAVRCGCLEMIPPGLDPVEATVAEPMASCIHAQEKGSVSADDVVVVIGAGPIGCIHLLLARARGARTVVMADASARRLALAARFEPDHLVDTSNADLTDTVRRITEGRGGDVVITANPDARTQVQAVDMAAKGGRVLLFGGVPPETSRPGIDTNTIHYSALTVIGATIYAPRHFRHAVELLSSGDVDAAKLISHRFALEDFERGARMALEGETLKAVFIT